MTVSSRNTKAQILSAYKDLMKDYKGLQKDFKDLQESKVAAVAPAAVAPSGSSDPTNFTISDIIVGLQSLRTGLAASTGDLQQKLIAEADYLADLAEKVESINTQLTELHDIEDPSAETLGQLVEGYQAEADAFEEELERLQKEHAEDLEAKQQAWAKEVDEHKLATKTRDEDLKRDRKRESEQYKYNLELERNLDEEQYQASKKEREKELAAQRELREKQWAERETELSEREKEFQELKSKADAFPVELESAVKKAKEEGVGIAKRNARIERSTLEKDHEGKLRVFEFKIASLEDTVKRQLQRIEKLSEQLQTAQNKAQDLAAQAIDGASNARSYEAVKEIAMEQAKNIGKSK